MSAIPYETMVVEEIVTKLACYYPRAKVVEWFNTPSKHFDGRSAREMIVDGEYDRVRLLAERMVRNAVAKSAKA